MKPRFTSTATTGTCRVCGDECRPQQGQRIAKHTEAGHYDLPWGEISPKRLKAMREEWIAANLQKRPKLCELLGRRASYRVVFQGKLVRVAEGTFDYSGQSFTFIEDDGVVWEIDADMALHPIRLCTHLTFMP